LDQRFYDANNQENFQKVLDKFGITKKYVLFLGTLEPSKNVPRLLAAFAKFKQKQKQQNMDKFEYQLVLAGKSGWLDKQLHQQVKDLGLSKDIVFTGYIIGDDLVPLFKKAEFFIMPSLYEGFGMTVLEAFATQTSAIISKVSSLPELAGEAAHFINPLDIDDIANSLSLFAEDEILRNKYRALGLEQAKKFDWDKCALETLAIYKSLK
jgi:glycosyltransferase involved in cell wall biosynthesis